eukprot:765499-Hanusia_phi.AAC.1
MSLKDRRSLARCLSQCLTVSRPQADLIVGSRFLHRPLFRQVRDGMLRPGGLLVWSTFLQGSSLVRPGRSLRPGMTWRSVNPPTARAGELREEFEEAGYEILID